MVSRLKLHSVSVLVVLALVLVETFVESQYYAEESSPRPVYVFNSDDVAHPAQPYFPPEEGRAFAGQVHGGDVAAAPGRMFAARKGRIDSDEEDDEEDDSNPSPQKPSTVTLPKGRIRPVKLPPGFDDKVKKRMKMRKRSREPLHGDPDPIDELDEEGRKPEARLLWPFSIEITKGNKDKGGGWGGGPGHYNSPPPHPDHPPPYAAPPGYPYPPDHPHDHPPYFDNDKEYDPDDDPEVQKLRIELFKMKKRTKKWKKIVGYNLAEIGAQLVTKIIEYLEFI